MVVSTLGTVWSPRLDRAVLVLEDVNEPLYRLVNALLLTPMGRRDWPLRFYSRERLFSVEARRTFVKPDLAALP
jgi:hypothetical protein